jgi:uncharacterized protein
MPNPFAHGQTDFSRLPAPDAPVLVGEAADLLKHIAPVAGKNLTFRTHDLGQPRDVTLVPFYQLHRERYSVYWKILLASEWQAQAADLAAAEAKRLAAEASVVDDVHPGESQSETDHKLSGHDTQSGDYYGHKWRHTADWFSYDLKVLPGQPLQLGCTLLGEDSGAREFDILVDGKIIATQKLDGKRGGGFYDVAFPIPVALTQGKATVTVKFAAHPGNLAGGIYGVRILRAAK